MPVRGVILILILAVLLAVVFRNQIYDSFSGFREEEDKEEIEKDVKEIIEE